MRRLVDCRPKFCLTPFILSPVPSPKFPGVEPGTRAAALPDAGVKLPSGLLATLGRPARESACECERVNDMQLGSVLALTSGPDLSRAIHDPGQ